jgi:hypothetical protein
MNGLTRGVFIVLLATASGACIFGSSDDGEGGGGSGSTTSSDGSTKSTTGSSSQGGGGSSADGGGGNGGEGGGPAQECTTLDDCEPPDTLCQFVDCVDATCVYSPLEGQPCELGVCDPTGTCVECYEDFHCGQDAICENDVCVIPNLGGACGDNFCQLLPADNACFSCIQTEGSPGGTCDVAYDACIDDGTMSGCTTCLEFFQGEGGAFCAGSQQIVLDLMDCMCTPGVCAE